MPNATDYHYVGDGRTQGVIIGRAAADLVGFYGTTPVNQPAAIAAVASSTTTTATTGNLQSSIDALVTTVNLIRTTLASMGLTA